MEQSIFRFVWAFPTPRLVRVTDRGETSCPGLSCSDLHPPFPVACLATDNMPLQGDFEPQV